MGKFLLKPFPREVFSLFENKYPWVIIDRECLFSVIVRKGDRAKGGIAEKFLFQMKTRQVAKEEIIQAGGGRKDVSKPCYRPVCPVAAYDQIVSFIKP